MTSNNIMDYRIYKVELVVALYNYDTTHTTTPLDFIGSAFDGLDAVILGQSEKKIHIVDSVQALTHVPQTITSATPAKKTRTKGIATNAHKRWTKKERATLRRLINNGTSTKEIAAQLGRTESAIDNQIFLSRKAK